MLHSIQLSLLKGANCSLTKSTKSELWSYVKTIILAIILSFFIQHFFFQPYTVKGDSMLPNLKDGNKIVVNKVNYKYGKPQRADLIVLKSPEHKEEYLVKRIVGLPGENISFKNDVLYVNGQKTAEPYLSKAKQEKLPYEQVTNDFTLKEIVGLAKIPKDYVLVLGDNRPISNDGRHFGLIKIDNIVGEVNMRYWPLNKISFMH